jgi:hypothetical protein
MEEQQMTTTDKPVSFVGRIPTVLFAAICVIAAIFGACLAFVVAAACFGIAHGTFGAQLEWLEAPAAIIAVLGGLVLPVYWLIARRRKQRARIEPTLSRAPDRGTADSAIAMKAPDPVTTASHVAATDQSTTSNTQLSTGAKWAMGSAGTIVLLVLFAGLKSSSSLDIEVRWNKPYFTPRATLHITNVGTTPTTILDVLLNDRIECSTVEPHVIKLFADLDNPVTPDGAHKMWVYTGDETLGSLLYHHHHVTKKSAAVLRYYRESLRPVELKTGDSFHWSISCNTGIVRATITTNKGSASYSFSR